MGDIDIERFSPQPDPELICPICHNVIHQPYETPCQHVFCKECIFTWIRRGRGAFADQGNKCPSCRDYVYQDELKPALTILCNLINKLKVKCINHGAGCEEVVPKEHLTKHEEACDYQEVQCKNTGCTVTLLKKDLGRHSESCAMRLMQCSKECQLRMPFYKLHRHNCLGELKSELKERYIEIAVMREMLASNRATEQNMNNLTNLRSDIGYAAGNVSFHRAVIISNYREENETLRTAEREMLDKLVPAQPAVNNHPAVDQGRPQAPTPTAAAAGGRNDTANSPAHSYYSDPPASPMSSNDDDVNYFLPFDPDNNENYLSDNSGRSRHNDDSGDEDDDNIDNAEHSGGDDDDDLINQSDINIMSEDDRSDDHQSHSNSSSLSDGDNDDDDYNHNSGNYNETGEGNNTTFDEGDDDGSDDGGNGEDEDNFNENDEDNYNNTDDNDDYDDDDQSDAGGDDNSNGGSDSYHDDDPDNDYNSGNDDDNSDRFSEEYSPEEHSDYENYDAEVTNQVETSPKYDNSQDGCEVRSPLNNEDDRSHTDEDTENIGEGILDSPINGSDKSDGENTLYMLPPSSPETQSNFSTRREQVSNSDQELSADTDGSFDSSVSPRNSNTPSGGDESETGESSCDVSVGSNGSDNFADDENQDVSEENATIDVIANQLSDEEKVKVKVEIHDSINISSEDEEDETFTSIGNADKQKSKSRSMSKSNRANLQLLSRESHAESVIAISDDDDARDEGGENRNVDASHSESAESPLEVKVEESDEESNRANDIRLPEKSSRSSVKIKRESSACQARRSCIKRELSSSESETEVKTENPNRLLGSPSEDICITLDDSDDNALGEQKTSSLLLDSGNHHSVDIKTRGESVDEDLLEASFEPDYTESDTDGEANGLRKRSMSGSRSTSHHSRLSHHPKKSNGSQRPKTHSGHNSSSGMSKRTADTHQPSQDMHSRKKRSTTVAELPSKLNKTSSAGVKRGALSPPLAPDAKRRNTCVDPTVDRLKRARFDEYL